MTADHRIGQVEIFDHGLQFTLVLLGHFAPEDHGDLLGLPGPRGYPTIHVQEALSELVHRGAAMEDEVVAILHLREAYRCGRLPFYGHLETRSDLQDLLVWQKAHRFVLEVYALTAAFP